LKKSATSPPAPKGLSAAAKAWWRALHSDFDLSEPHCRLLLETALKAFDRMNEAAAVLDAEGVTIRDRFEQVKPHPLIPVERDARAGMLAALKALNLDVEPTRAGPGRPAGQS